VADASTVPPTVSAVPRLLRAEPVMGTVVSLDLRGPVGPGGRQRCADAVDAACAVLHRADEDFSTYRADSWVSRLERGEVSPGDCPPQVREVLDACEHYRLETGGWFDCRAGGRLDPSGLVKGWAAAAAADCLDEAGIPSYSLNAGGDVVLRGLPEPGRPWSVGVVDPTDRARLLAAVPGDPAGARRAVATSGVAERGEHVLDPRTGRPSLDLLSVTVVAADLVLADVWATAVLAAGDARTPLLIALERRGCSWLTVGRDGSARASEHFPGRFYPPAP